jgi:hypothetical protein
MARMRWKVAAAAGTIGIGLGFGAVLRVAVADTSDFTTPGSNEFTAPEGVCSVTVDARRQRAR